VTLEGEWRVIRVSGALPPLPGVRKRISGERGVTALGRLPGVPFAVQGLVLRYRKPLGGFADVLQPDAEGFQGRATFCGRAFGRFVLRRVDR
jgi:hypothetical protein